MGEDEYHGEEQRRPWSLPRHDAKDPGDGERHAAAKQSRRGEIFSVLVERKEREVGIRAGASMDGIPSSLCFSCERYRRERDQGRGEQQGCKRDLKAL